VFALVNNLHGFYLGAMQADSAPSVQRTQAPAPPWAARMRSINNWLLYDLGGGPRPLKFAWLVDAQKALTLPVLALCMFFYKDQTPQATSTAAFVYLGLHGAYGLVWFLKAVTFPDPNWQVFITLPSSVVVAVCLGLYWCIGWLLISGTSQLAYPLPEPVWFTLCIVICTLGVAIMLAADAQKYFTLKVKRGLITDGMFRYIRHPNYLGEMMIYLALALMAWHWFPAVVLAFVWIQLFAVNMVMKEASMSRYPEWQAYKQRTYWLIPYLL
jgi:protein-S-isoprenylcysteine O-methyltransferase Ste14